MKIAIVGLGLIGGSMARDLRSQINVNVYGVEQNPEHVKLAEGLGLVDGFMTLEEAEQSCEVIILAVPVTTIESLLPSILDRISDDKIIIDLGSTKSAICAMVESHPMRSRYVASHPLAGTEFSGPTAALRGLFNNKKNIICEPEKSASDALDKAIAVFNSVGLNTIMMSADDHDKHLAYVSHLSHVSSFMLGLTVLNIENDEKQIFNLASTGFESTVRLAKSNPHTWYPIFSKNKKYVSTALASYIDLLTTFKEALDTDNEEVLKNYMVKANDIKRILNN
jgi:prephenate dehydrogenase